MVKLYYKMDKKIEKDIINCSRCGLCMDVCPVYKAKKTETSVSRGKFLQLLGLIRGDLKMNKKIAYNLDLCLFCGKCKSSCPSDINAVQIFAQIKAENLSFLDKIFYSALIFKLKMFVLKIFYKLKYPIGRKNPKNYINEKITYFKGCGTNAMSFGLIGSNLIKEKFECCGLPYFTKGRIDLYEKCKNKNLKLIEKYNKIVFDCATCYDTILKYEGIDKEKIIYFTDFYKSKKLQSKNPVKVTFHKPCHLSNDKFIEIENILQNIKNVEYIKMPKADDCCGFGGDFFTRHPKTADFLSKEKIKNAIQTNADIILTTCPTCLWSLKYGINTKKAKLKAYDLAEFLQSLIEI